VQGAVAYLRDGLGGCKAVVDASATYRTGCDTLGTFLKDCCVVGPSERVNHADFLAAWKTGIPLTAPSPGRCAL